jgi:hypothetical protein
VQIYPNPASEQAFISVKVKDPKDKSIKLQFYNLTGLLQKTEVISLNSYGYGETQLQCGSLPKGLYVYNVMSGTTVITRGKLVVQ